MDGAAPHMLPCPNCGFPNEADDSFCGQCRHPLGASDTTPTTTAPSPATPGMPTPATANPPVACPHCGFSNDADDQFCGSCGKALGQPTVAAPTAAIPVAAAAATPTKAPPAAISAPPIAPKPQPPTTPLRPGEVACPNCGTANAESRLFCIKCATQLRADALPPKKAPLRLNRGMILPFVLSTVIGLGATVGGARLGAIVLAKAPAPTAGPGNPQATPIIVTGSGGDPVGLQLTPAAPKPLDPLPDNSTIRLADYKVPTPSEANDPNHQEPWWSNTVPRVPAVSQFDGGPLQGVNCVMASGAMLARLAFGIVTTGSQLRALQTDQDGPSSYSDLNAAVEKGWGVGFLRGLLTATQLRALSYAGAGIVVSLNYGEVSENVRLQKSFTGNHSVYLDAFSPDALNGRPAYWVMDPIGHAWAGYKGGWWPAEDIERAGMARSGGKIYASWAFAGGIVPDRHKILPPDAYPGGPTAAPTDVTSSPDPMPTGSLPVPADDPDTGTPPPDVPQFLPITINTDVFVVQPTPEGLACTTTPLPAGCPGGIIGVIGQGAPGNPTAPPITTIDVLYGTVIAPGTVQIVFDAPAGTLGQLWTWGGVGLPLLQSTAQSAVIGSTNVSVANIAVDSSGTLSFFATATSPSYSGFSTVGTLVVGS
jgi:hypothetical protein